MCIKKILQTTLYMTYQGYKTLLISSFLTQPTSIHSIYLLILILILIHLLNKQSIQWYEIVFELNRLISITSLYHVSYKIQQMPVCHLVRTSRPGDLGCIPIYKKQRCHLECWATLLETMCIHSEACKLIYFLLCAESTFMKNMLSNSLF